MILTYKKSRNRQMIKVGSQTTEPKMDFKNKQCRNKWVVTWEKIKLDSYLVPYIRINSKWIKDLNVKK